MALSQKQKNQIQELWEETIKDAFIEDIEIEEVSDWLEAKEYLIELLKKED